MQDVIKIIRMEEKMKFSCRMRYKNCKGTSQKSISLGIRHYQKDLPGQSIGHTSTKLLQSKINMMFTKLNQIIEKADIEMQII